MARPRIPVTAAELETAILVWLRVVPDGVWRKNQEEERKKAEKRWRAGEFPDPKLELAKYLATKFEQAGWVATRPTPSGLFDAALPEDEAG